MVVNTGTTKVLSASFFSLSDLLSPIHIFFSKKHDDAQTHFGVANYRLWILLCTFWDCNRHQKHVWTPPNTSWTGKWAAVQVRRTFVFSDLEGALRMPLQKGHSEPCLSKVKELTEICVPAQRNVACWSSWLRIDIYDILCKNMSLIMYEMCITSVYTQICASVVFKSWHKYITVCITTTV